MTSGTYENEKLPEDRELKDLILNNSQRICAQTNDLTPPCPPQSLIVSDEFSCENYFDNQSCDIREFENRIEWQVDGIYVERIQDFLISIFLMTIKILIKLVTPQTHFLFIKIYQVYRDIIMSLLLIDQETKVCRPIHL